MELLQIESFVECICILTRTTRKTVSHIGLVNDIPRIENYTLRNNWENFHGYLNTRNLVVCNNIVMSSSNNYILSRTLSPKKTYMGNISVYNILYLFMNGIFV